MISAPPASCNGSDGRGSIRGRCFEGSIVPARPCIHFSCIHVCCSRRVIRVCLQEQHSLSFYEPLQGHAAGHHGRCLRHAGGSGGSVLDVGFAALLLHRAPLVAPRSHDRACLDVLVKGHQWPPMARGDQCQCCGWAGSHFGPRWRPLGSLTVAGRYGLKPTVTDVTDVL